MKLKNLKIIRKYTEEYFKNSFGVEEFKNSKLYKLNKNKIKNVDDMINIVVNENKHYEEWESINTFYNSCINFMI